MPKSLWEYADWLSQRDDLIWPEPPVQSAVKAVPSLKPIPAIKGVVWNIYGTLLRITDGELSQVASQPLRMQIALEKTIQEFNMWQSMYRKPGAPWEYLLSQYQDVLSEMQMTAPVAKGDVPEVSSTRLWRKLISRLEQKEYQYDAEFYGDPDEYAEKVAYFFHASLQGVGAMPRAADVVTAVMNAGLAQGLLADGQSFTLTQLLQVLLPSNRLSPRGLVCTPGCVVISSDVGVKKPSLTLFQTAVEAFSRLGLEPAEVLYVSNRLRDDLSVAKQFGFRTVLFAGDKQSLRASTEDLANPDIRPDRLLTKLTQIRHLLEE